MDVKAINSAVYSGGPRAVRWVRLSSLYKTASYDVKLANTVLLSSELRRRSIRDRRGVNRYFQAKLS